MEVLTLDTPEGLEQSSEFPAPASEWPEMPLWTENMCFVAYDPGSEIGLWSHLGRAPFDLTLWRELTMIYLPSGDRLVNKSYGRTETERGPGAACLSYECVEPWNLWRSRRDGPVGRMTEEQLDRSMATDRAQERAGFDLEWRPLSPIWDWGEVEDEHRWGKTHYEQLARVTGQFVIGGEEFAFDGAGLRDHTSGARDFTVFSGHIWAWANFPSGRGFILLQVIVDGNDLTRAVLLEDGKLTSVPMHNRPIISDRSQGRDDYELELGDHRIGVELLHTLPNGFAGPNNICIGYDPEVVETANFESFSRFTWEGEVGHGLTQRSVKER
jgi:hypothetical protein